METDNINEILKSAKETDDYLTQMLERLVSIEKFKDRLVYCSKHTNSLRQINTPRMQAKSENGRNGELMLAKNYLLSHAIQTGERRTQIRIQTEQYTPEEMAAGMALALGIRIKHKGGILYICDWEF